MRINGKNLATLKAKMFGRDLAARRLAYCELLAHLDPTYPVGYTRAHCSLFTVIALLEQRLRE